MRPECVSRVTAAAAAKGRQLSIADLNGIEARVRNNLRQLRRAKGEADFMGMTREQRMQEAAKMAADQLIADKVLKKQRAARDIQVVHSLNSLVDEIQTRIPGISRLDALDRILFQKQDGRAGVFSLEDRINGTQKAYLRQLESLFDLADRGHLASVFADPEATAAFTRELRGQDSGNPAAKQAADAVRQVMDAQVKQYRALGGKLDPLADYAHPQETSTRLARQMGQDKWVDFTVTKLDRSRYVNEDGTLMSDVQVRRFLGEAWKSLAHNGAAKAPGANVGKGLGALGNQRAAHRQLHFKDADSWMEYSKQLSESDMFSMVLNRVNSMSRDIAVLEVLGHNPANMTAKLFGEARAADASADTGAGGKTDWDAKEGYLDRKFRYMAGGSDVFSQHGFARFLRGYRNVKVGSSMGSLLFAQLGDQGTMAAIARQNNASLKMLYDGQRMFFTPEGRQRMKALGLGIDLMADELARIGDINSNVGITGKLATLTHRLSLATAMTNMERQAFRYMMWGSMADMVKKTDTLAGLHERDARVLRSKGLTDTDWAVWRMADPEVVGDATLLTPAAIDAIPDAKLKPLGNPATLKQEAIIKLYGTTDMETNTAILQPNVSERFALRSLGGNIDPNSVVGEIAATFLQFKGFPFAYLNRHIDRMAFEGGVNRWKYGLSIVAATTVMGGFAVLLSEMAKGQDPRDIEANPGRFALESFLKGGGLGIYGDILLKPQEQGFQSSLADVALGPVVGDLSKAWNITTGLKNLPVADDPEKVKDQIAASTVRLVKGNTPFANLWYTRAMTDRWLFNQASEWANPGYLERMKKRAAKQGTTFYYEPDAEFGEFPERGPDLGKAVGNPSAP